MSAEIFICDIIFIAVAGVAKFFIISLSNVFSIYWIAYKTLCDVIFKTCLEMRDTKLLLMYCLPKVTPRTENLPLRALWLYETHYYDNTPHYATTQTTQSTLYSLGGAGALFDHNVLGPMPFRWRI